MEKFPRYQNQFFFILLGISFVLVFFILRPFLITLIMSVIFATVLYPMYRWIQRPFKAWKAIPAALTILIALAFIITPAVFLTSRIITEATQAYANIGTELANPDHLTQRIQEPIRQFIPWFNIDLDSIVKPILQMLSDRAGSIFTTTVATIVNIVIFFIGVFFLLKNGNDIKQWIMDVSPLPNTYDGIIMQQLTATMNSVIRGSLFVAIIQGIAAGIGYMLFGVPNPTLLGLLTSVASLIPGIGTPIVTLPSAAYLFFSGHQLAGLGMALWGLAGVGLIDNIIGPQIVGAGKGVNVHPFLILVSVLGGLAFFGPWGFILGPVTVSLFLSLIDVFAEYLDNQNVEQKIERRYQDPRRSVRTVKTRKIEVKKERPYIKK